MKNRCVALLLIGSLILQNACTVRIPVAGNKQSLHNSAERVSNPYYSVKKKSKHWFYLPFVAAGVGAGGYYLSSEQDQRNPKTKEELHKRGLLGATVFSAVITLPYFIAIAKSKPRISNENVSTQRFDQWLSDYNKKERQSYTRYQADGNGYLIIPRNSVTAYEAEEKRRKEEAERKQAEYEQAVSLKKQQREEKEKVRIEKIRQLSLSSELLPEFQVIKTGTYGRYFKITSYCIEIVAKGYNPNSADHWSYLVEFIKGFDPEQKGDATIFFTFYDSFIDTSECSCDLDNEDCSITYKKNRITNGHISPWIDGNRSVMITPNAQYRVNSQGGMSSVETGKYGEWTFNLL